MNHAKKIAQRFPKLSRLAGLAGLFAVGLLFCAVSSSAPVLEGQASNDSSFVALNGGPLDDDFFEALAFDGMEPTNLPVAQQTPAAAPNAKSTLPSRVDNSLNKYFPPIIQQKGGSCGQASGIHYTFTYEMNLARDLDSRQLLNQYPDHWTWNCLNGATGGGSRAVQGWGVIKDIGIPTLDVYGDKFSLHNDYGWPTGYDKYYAAMKNRVDSFGTIPATNPADLDRIKGYLYNHNDPSQKYGGLMNYRIFFGGRKTVKIPQGQYEAGRSVITAWGATGAHGMTYIGYDDNVGFDLNGDGKITNDIDINGDSKIDMCDWERGAFMWANSHGLKSGEEGKGYVLYSLAAQPKEKGRGDVAYWVIVKKEYQPKVALMLRFKFDDRSALQLSAGFAGSAEATKPAKTFQPGVYNGKFNVGKVPMRGKGIAEPIEIGIDLTDIASTSGTGKYFVNLSRKSGSTAKGELQGVCVYRYDDKGGIVSAHNFAIPQPAFGDAKLDLSVLVK